MQFAVDNPYAAPLNGIFIPHSYKPSLINEILKKPDVQLEELLNQEDFIDQFKNGNTAILDYFTNNYQQIKRLVEYITQVAPDLQDNKRAYEYPLLAYEIFEEDNAAIMDTFFFSNPMNVNPNIYQGSSARKSSTDIPVNSETAATNQAEQQPGATESINLGQTGNGERTNIKNEDLLSYLFSFLDTKDELNPVLAGYFNNLVLKLLKRNQKKVIEFVYNNTQILFNLVDHIGQHSISELIPMFLCYQHFLFDDNSQERLRIRLQVIEKIFSVLSNVNKSEEMAHVAEIVSEILLRNEMMADGKEIMGKILSKETFTRVFSILEGDIGNNSITYIGNVILTLLGHFTARKNGQYSPRGMYSSYMQRGYDDDPVIGAICENIERLNKLLLGGNENTINTTFGQNAGRLGLGKLKIVDIVERIIRIDSKKIYRKINEVGIVTTLTEMFGKFIWNNMLHISYEKLVYTILDKRDSALMEALFEKASFVNYIVNEIKEEQFGFPKSQRKIRKGNMGFIVKLANELARLGSFEKALEEQLKKNPDWETIVVPNLRTQNELDNKDMGGYNPRNRGGMGFGMTDSLLGYTQFSTGLLGGFSGLSGLSGLGGLGGLGGGYYTASTSSYLTPQNDSQLSTPSYLGQTGQTGLLGIQSSPPQEQKTDGLIGVNPFYYAKPRDSLELDKFSSLIKNRDAQPAIEPVNQEKLDTGIQPVVLPEVQPFKYTPPNETPQIKDQPNQESTLPTKPLILDSVKIEKPEKKVNSRYQDYDENTDAHDESNIEHTDEMLAKKDSLVAPTRNSNDLSQIVSKQLQSSTDILNRLKFELNISPSRDAKNKELELELEDDPIIKQPKRFDSCNPSPVSASADGKTLRNSMIEMKSGKKVKLRIKKAEKLDGSKILDMINKFKTPSMTSSMTSVTSSMELSCSDNTQSESGNLGEDPSQTIQEAPTVHLSETAALMAQLTALREKELA